MKTLLRKTNKPAFDNLLRSHIGPQPGSRSACPEFDPDRANAYIERGLAGVERARYERHLSDCAGCRTSVVALARMADADSTKSPLPNIARNSRLGESGWLASLKAGLWVIASPRWAIVATALLVMGISIPLLVGRGGARRNAQDSYLAKVDEPAAAAEPRAPTLNEQERFLSNAAPERSQQQTTLRKSTDKDAPRRERAAGDLKQEERETTGVVAAARQPAAADAVERKKVDNGDVAEARDDSRVKDNAEKVTGGAGASAPAAPALADENKSRTTISKESALKLPAENTGSASVKTLKPGTVDAGPKSEREKLALATITPKESEAPKQKASLEGDSRPGLSSRSRSRALVGGESRVDRSHSPEKKIGKRSFWLSRGVWTDSEYNSDQKLPVVTVVRDSDVYKELLEKNNKLKTFFKGFLETERAIIVYKGTVYNLIPQSDSK